MTRAADGRDPGAAAALAAIGLYLGALALWAALSASLPSFSDWRLWLVLAGPLVWLHGLSREWAVRLVPWSIPLTIASGSAAAVLALTGQRFDPAGRTVVGVAGALVACMGLAAWAALRMRDAAPLWLELFAVPLGIGALWGAVSTRSRLPGVAAEIRRNWDGR